MYSAKRSQVLYLIQNHYFKLATVIILLSWQFSLYDGEERDYRLNDFIYSLSIHFSLWIQLVCAHDCRIIHGFYWTFFIMSKHSGIEIEALSPLCVLEHLKNKILFVRITHASILTDTQVVWMAGYTAYKKFPVQVKALLKLVLYGNMALKGWSQDEI